MYMGAKYLLQDFEVRIGGGLMVEMGILTRYYCIRKTQV